MKIKERFIVRKIAEHYMAVPLGHTAMSHHGLVALNETAAFLWKHLQENHHTIESLAAVLMQEYDSAKEDAVQTVTHFCEKLSQDGYLERV